MNGSPISYSRSVYWCCPVCVRHPGRYRRRTGWAAGRSLVLGGSQAAQGECSRVFWLTTVHTDLEVGLSQQDRHVCGFAWLWDRTSETPWWEPGECGPELRGPHQRELSSAGTRRESEPVNFICTVSSGRCQLSTPVACGQIRQAELGGNTERPGPAGLQEETGFKSPHSVKYVKQNRTK